MTKKKERVTTSFAASTDGNILAIAETFDSYSALHKKTKVVLDNTERGAVFQLNGHGPPFLLIPFSLWKELSPNAKGIKNVATTSQNFDWKHGEHLANLASERSVLLITRFRRTGAVILTKSLFESLSAKLKQQPGQTNSERLLTLAAEFAREGRPVQIEVIGKDGVTTKVAVNIPSTSDAPAATVN